MNRHRLPAVFMRGGTSKALMLHRHDLPAAQAEWNPIFLRAMGSPDPNGRQLDGMGGGLSSVSKVCVLSRSSRPDADIDYTFAQVMVKDAHVDYSGNCGNMSSAVGPFAVDEGLVDAADGEATVRIYNTNTDKIIHSTFAVHGGQAVERGELAIPGVAGTGAPIRLDFVSPGGASTGRLLPSGRVVDEVEVPGLGKVEVSMVDAANACVLVAAS
jgi:2-methylaconitate cis-trans-isomerase PrpF